MLHGHPQTCQCILKIMILLQIRASNEYVFAEKKKKLKTSLRGIGIRSLGRRGGMRLHAQMKNVALNRTGAISSCVAGGKAKIYGCRCGQDGAFPGGKIRQSSGIVSIGKENNIGHGLRKWKERGIGCQEEKNTTVSIETGRVVGLGNCKITPQPPGPT